MSQFDATRRPTVELSSREASPLGPELCRKYALTSLNLGGGSAGLLAIDEAVERCAQIADGCGMQSIAERIRNLKTFHDEAHAVAA